MLATVRIRSWRITRYPDIEQLTQTLKSPNDGWRTALPSNNRVAIPTALWTSSSSLGAQRLGMPLGHCLSAGHAKNKTAGPGHSPNQRYFH
jgi:hypothetical protein